jgi:spore coat polysaccharide biosynthesis predicted glycosyltransferase SpsG
MTKKILIRVDGSKKIGLGHVYNMLTILHHFQNEQILIVMNKNNKLGSSKFKEKKYKVKFFQNNSELLKIISNFEPDIIFNDILNTKINYMKKIGKLSSMIVNFEDVGEGRAHADLVFNPIFNQKKMLTKEFYGGKFACVRDEFRIWTSNILRKNVKKILVSFGGTDPTQITTKIFTVIENLSLKNIEFIIMLGFGFDHKKEIKKSANYLIKNGFRIKLIEKSDLLAKYIRYVDFAIVSNGRTVFEVASMQVPILSVAVNDREKSHTFVRDEKIGKHINYNPKSFTKELSCDIEYLLEYKNRKKFKSKLKKLQLLYGVEKVIDIINNEFKLRS